MRRLLASLAIFSLFIPLFLQYGAIPSEAAAAELFFSEYIEGSSNNKALEIYNATGAPVNLATGGYNVQMYFNGNPTATLTINLTGTVANGDVFVLAQASANATILAQADQTNGSGWFNGDDAVVLRKGTMIIDSIGQAGFDPGTEWGSGLLSTADNTIRRKATVCGGDVNAGNVFDPAGEWDGFANDTFGGLGSHTSNCTAETAPAVLSTSPAAGATEVSIGSNITINFNEPVNVTGSWFTISCGSSGTHTASSSSNPASTSFTLNPDSDFAFSETCTVTVAANQVTDQDINDPPDVMAANYVFSFTTGGDPCTSPYTNIYTVQGSGSASPSPNGTNFTIRGVVVGDFQGSANFNGFYLQDPDGDGIEATSDGIFVFAPGGADVSAGDDVVVKGKVAEFNGLTEIDNVVSITVCGAGSVAPTPVSLPVAAAGDLERYEGMLVTIPQTLTVTENFNLGRFGELTLSSDGRLFQPTNSNLPLSPGALAEAQGNVLRRIVLDDGQSNQNPNPIPHLDAATQTRRVGDTVAGLTGVLDYRFSAYRVQPTQAPAFTSANPRTAAPDPVGGNVKVASFNVLNYFTNLDLGSNDDHNPDDNNVAPEEPQARGADNSTEFGRQRAKVVAALQAIDADVVGIIEVENYNNSPSNSPEAIDDLVAALNAAYGSATYQAIIGTDPGTDAIMNALIYKPARVTPVGAAVNDVDPAWTGARNPLAQTFQYNANGEKFTFIVNHFVSKGCSASDVGGDADQGDGQGCDNLSRKLQAERLLTFIAARQAAAGDQDVLVMGDLNAYGMEDPINILTAGGLVNELAKAIERPYSYVFQAQSGYLDHALSTASLSAQVSGVTEWHINADEPPVLDYNTEFKTQDLYAPTPYRSSDHDPVVVGLDLNAPPSVGAISATPNPGVLNGAINFSATFTDPDPADTHTAVWNWGDGTTSDGTVSGGSVSGSHAYAAVGTYTVTLTVTDGYGNEGTSTMSIPVGYAVLALYDEAKAHKLGSTVPIKLQLQDANGVNLSSEETTVNVLGLAQVSNAAAEDLAETESTANPDGNFRYDPTLGGYIFNLRTKGLSTGTYYLYFTAEGDPVVHTVMFQVR